MKKIFILTAEPSGDKLASRVISKCKSLRTDIEYLSVGGENLNSLGIKSLYDLKEITYLGFTKVLLNILKIKKKINQTVSEIIKFKPDVLFSVDSPDFTLRVVKEVKRRDPNIKTIHLVAPQVWIWREHRVKHLKSFLDHILLLFPFEKKYFDKEDIQSTFIGHPLLDEEVKNKVDISQIMKDKKNLFSIFPGSRLSEVNVLMPILIKFIKLMNKIHLDYFFIFHSTNDHNLLIKNILRNENLENCDVVSNEVIKSHILKNSIFAVAKSGTISLEICNAKVPSIIIYKMNKINFFIIKCLVKVKSPNIINIAANEEVIPELLQSKCNPNDIFKTVNKLLKDKNALDIQINKSQEIINVFKKPSSAKIACQVLLNYL